MSYIIRNVIEDIPERDVRHIIAGVLVAVAVVIIGAVAVCLL